MQTVCVIPAAGRSSRMGDWKPLLPWGQTTIIETVISVALAAGCRPLVVCGYRAAELAAKLAGRPELDTVYNPDWEAGMLDSVRCGVRAAATLAGAEVRRAVARGAPAASGTVAESGADAAPGGCLVLPADMPLLPPEVIELLLEQAARESAGGPDRPLSLFPTCGGTSGHPVWISFGLLPAMEALAPDGRLRAFLQTQAHALVECGQPGILLDLDTTEAYLAAKPAG